MRNSRERRAHKDSSRQQEHGTQSARSCDVVDRQAEEPKMIECQ